MERINTTNKEVDLFGAGKHGFRDGNPGTGVFATFLSAAWFNALQEEIANVIEGAGIALNPGDNTQLTAAIQAWIAGYASSAYLPKAGGTMTGALNFADEAVLGSAAAVDLGGAASNNINLTGATTITSFGVAAAGISRLVRVNGTFQITHGAALLLPGAVNIAAVAGDYFLAISRGAGNWRVPFYQKVNGQSLVFPAASQADMEAASSATVGVTPAVARHAPSALKVWGSCGVSGDLGSPSFGVSSAVDGGAGMVTINTSAAFSSGNHAPVCTLLNNSNLDGMVNGRGTTSFNLECRNGSNTPQDPTTGYSFHVAGDQ